MKALLQSTFALPALIAILASVGLIAALFGDGLFDLVSWLTLGVGIIAVILARCATGPRDKD
ncbi:hypothetical protein [Ponticaulis sp.]|uniref:hypothetical protein n=1 Tax=Ponticaulis sp. TaxID=2020902 RepID=UPI000B7344A7|nr:hypothetical protein [Ponticaulis sp.]MAI91435.1 hypothetical protein [Ponticaulis sp.]OUX97792.1 MAG: hypothetical protein CBB65_13415 [Hyphomonadaceae bacterium TMED5]|tara:strand:- start:56486 stop:56671 length:186 start_codon:yes stop_codon:yes gene_type:complete